MKAGNTVSGGNNIIGYAGIHPVKANTVKNVEIGSMLVKKDITGNYYNVGKLTYKKENADGTITLNITRPLYASQENGPQSRSKFRIEGKENLSPNASIAYYK